MVIEKDKPVQLTRHVGHNGNFYHPREYLPGELPEALMVEGLVTQAPKTTLFSPQPDNFIKQEIDITVETSAVVAASFPGQPAVIIDGAEKFLINKDNADKLSTIPGIGSALALKIIEEREKSLFKDARDLDKRVPLTRVKWTSLENKLNFDA